MPELYLTVEEVRNQIGKLHDNKDGVFQELIEAACDMIRNHCGRPDGFMADTEPTVRLYDAIYDDHLLIDETPLITGISVKANLSDTIFVPWVDTDWIPFSGSIKHPNFNKKPYTGIMLTADSTYSSFRVGGGSTSWAFGGAFEGHRRHLPSIQIEAHWGHSLTVPPAIKQATIIQVARWFKRGEASWSDAAGNQQFGVLYVRGLDAEVKEILENGRFMRLAI